MVEATPSYKERMKAARAEARAQRLAERAAWQRMIELRCEVSREARALVKKQIADRGRRSRTTCQRISLEWRKT